MAVSYPCFPSHMQDLGAWAGSAGEHIEPMIHMKEDICTGCTLREEARGEVYGQVQV